jgi:serine/threonine-protein kinase
MDRQRWETLQSIADRVVDAPPGDREQIIAEACAGDADLERDLRRLLGAMDDQAFLETPAPDMLAGADESSQPQVAREGQRIGPFVLRERIGVGGMGAVYRAERADAAFEQIVALKLIDRPFATEPGEGVSARFLREQRTLASLEHPGIARFIDGGVTETGAPYIAMELVEGETIDAYARRLALRDRLRLFVSVCDAVQHAHTRLIVHRDLKPANILVTQDGRPVLLDFGIAKLIDDEAEGEARRGGARDPTLTRGHAPLTMQYAAPEQVTGEPITAATDVYALGLILYELLIGEPAYRVTTRSLAGAAQTIRSTRPERPSTKAASIGGPRAARLAKSLRGDLDTIVLRSLDKDPVRRYRSAAELGEDVSRHLRGVPVLARPDTVSYRLRKFVGRNRAAVASVAAVVLVLAGGLAVSLTSLDAVRDAREREQDQRLAAEEMNRFLISMFEAVDPAQTKAQDVGVLRSLLEAGADRLDDELGSRPVAAARMRATIGSTYRLIGNYDGAAALLERNLRERTELLGPDHPETLASAQQLGALYIATGAFDRAAPLLSRTLEKQRSLLGSNHADTLRTMNDLGEALRKSGEIERAAAMLEEALAGREQTLGERDRETLITMNNVAGVLVQQGDYESALPIAERVYELQRTVLGDDHLDTLISAGDLGLIHRNLGRPDVAVNYGRTAYEGLSRTLGADHMDTLVVGTNLAGQLRSLGRQHEALDLYAELEASARESLPDGHYLVPWLLGVRGLCMLDLERFDDAEPLFLASHEGLAASLGEDHQFTQMLAGRLAAFYDERGKPEEADRWRVRTGGQ